MAMQDQFDHVIINDDLATAIDAVDAIFDTLIR